MIQTTFFLLPLAPMRVKAIKILLIGNPQIPISSVFTQLDKSKLKILTSSQLLLKKKQNYNQSLKKIVLFKTIKHKVLSAPKVACRPSGSKTKNLGGNKSRPRRCILMILYISEFVNSC